MPPHLKSYILIRSSVPTSFAVLAAAHASLAVYLKFEHSDEVRAWISGTFYKTVCMVSDEEFAQAKEVPEHVVITESALDGQEVAIAFRPRTEWPKSFKYFRLYR